MAFSSFSEITPSPLNTPVFFSKYSIIERVCDLEFSPFSFLSAVIYL